MGWSIPSFLNAPDISKHAYGTHISKHPHMGQSIQKMDQVKYVEDSL